MINIKRSSKIEYLSQVEVVSVKIIVAGGYFFFKQCWCLDVACDILMAYEKLKIPLCSSLLRFY